MEVSELFALSDTLGMELLLNTVTGRVDGKTTREVEFKNLGLKLTLRPTVVSSRTEPSMTGLVVRIAGDLHVAVIHDQDMMEVRTMVLDQRKFVGGLNGLFESNKGKGLDAFTLALQPMAVADFCRSEYETKWVASETA
jgi:hypothetical protein